MSGLVGNPFLLTSAGGATGYQIERSLRFNSSDSAYLSRTPASAGNRKTWTWAGWVKRSGTGNGSLFTTNGSGDSGLFSFEIDSNNLRLAGQLTQWLRTSAVFRDFSAWYHIVLATDTTQATAADRFKLYVNGVQITAFAATSYPPQNADLGVNSTVLHHIGAYWNTSPDFNGYLADVHFIDGQALDPSSFVETSATTGQLIPKAYTGTFTGNSFWLKFADNSAATATTLGKDSSGLGNNWTPNNLSVTAGAGNDSLVDTPTSYGTDTGAGGEVRGNYATLNPLALNGTLSNGNLDLSTTTVNAQASTFFLSSGKWYWEFLISSNGGSDAYIRAGVCNPTGVGQSLGATANGWCFLGDGRVYNNGSASNYGTSITTNDVLNVAVDIDAGKLWYGKNGTWMASGNPATGANPSQTFTAGTSLSPALAAGGGTVTISLNAGQRAFQAAAPSGYKALCDTNLAAPVVAKPSTVMDVALWTGNGSARSITGLGFNPDLVWIKGRSGATDHALYDVVRGAEKRLESNTTDAEVTSDGGVTAFNSDGFSLGTLAQVNTNSATYAGWAWDAGTTTSSNGSGSITSQVRANATAGFSVATWSGTGSGSVSVGHGLGVAPQFFIIKDRSNARNWLVYHVGMGATRGMQLNLTTAQSGADAGYWNNTAPTSTVATIGTYGNESANYVGYFWAPQVGYSSFGSYTGNGSTDGPFVFTGFRPKWLMIKVTNISGESWVMKDAVRNPYNPVEANFYADLSASEQTSNATRLIDFTSNGFKLRGTEVSVNGSGNTYVYMCFAESPFQYARAR